MSKRLIAVLTALLMLLVSGCGNSGQGDSANSIAQESSIQSEESASDHNGSEVPPQAEAGTLVVFFSRHENAPEGVDAVSSATLSSNDVTILAQMIQKAVPGADLHQVITVDAYPAAYDAATKVARTELDEDARPALANRVENMEQYDTIYLGYPIWWGTIPMPVATFLESYDLSGKTIVPFCTHEGSGIGSSQQEIAQLAPNATVLEGFAVSGNQAANAEEDIVAWISSLDLG